SYFVQLLYQVGVVASATAGLGCFRIYRETLSRFSCAASRPSSMHQQQLQILLETISYRSVCDKTEGFGIVKKIHYVYMDTLCAPKRPGRKEKVNISFL
ncbi:hypothetical protein, partial [Pedobacter steynii]